MNILAFAGRRYTGKTKASSIVLELAPAFRRVSFSDAPREEFCKYHKLDIAELLTPGVKERYRVAFIEFAEGRKEKDKYHWANLLFEKVLSTDNIVIDDLRFIEELHTIIKNKGIVYKMQAELEIRKQRGWIPNPYIDNDITETEMDLSPYTFWELTKGGGIFNNEIGADTKLRGQLLSIMAIHFNKISV
jgi:phosphomevalonate kinase